MKAFKYKREVTVAKKGEDGQPIPRLDEHGNVMEGLYEIEKTIAYDVINLDLVVRSYQMAEDQVLVLLNDGHEVTEKQRALKNAKRPPTIDNIIEVKERVYVQSEILLTGEDIERFYSALEV